MNKNEFCLLYQIFIFIIFLTISIALFKIINKPNKYGYYERPNCKKCLHRLNCNKGENDCNKLIGWIRPCLQGCKNHNSIEGCYIENMVLMTHRSLKECRSFKNEK